MKNLIAQLRSLNVTKGRFALWLIALVAVAGVAANELRVYRMASEFSGLVSDTNAIHSKTHGGKFGANVDHSTTTIHGGHSLVVEGDSLGGFMSGADKTKLDGVATGAQAVTAANVQTATATLASALPFNGQKGTGVANGTASTDVAAFGQIQSALNASTYKNTVNVVSTSNVATLSGLAQTVDGVALSGAGMRALLPAQTTTTQDACYVVASGAWTLCPDLAVGTSAEGAVFIAESGTANKGVWVIHNAGAQVVGTNDLTAANVAASGGSVTFSAVQSALAGATSAVDFNAQTVQNIANGALATDAINLSQKKLHGALFVSTGPLPANTYSNGTGGHGATLTYNSNVACGLIDGHTVALNDVGLVAAEAAMANNGLYKATQLGNGSTTPCILTRVDYADDPVELAGLQVEVVDGFTAKTGAPVYIVVAPSASITVGTTGLVFLRASLGGGPRLAYSWSTDFDSGIATFASGVAVNNSPFTSSPSGTGATVALNSTGAGNTDTEIGIATLTSGTSAAATSAMGNFGGMFNWGTNAAIWNMTKLRVHTALSGATNTFDCHLGTVAGAYAAGVWESCDSNADTHWRLNVKAAGTTTVVGTSLIVLDQWDTLLNWKDAGSTQVHWAVSGVQQPDPATTNTPTSTPTAPYLSVDRSAGTGGVIQIDYSAGQYYLPAGRGL